jgi:hypothetical protein
MFDASGATITPEQADESLNLAIVALKGSSSGRPPLSSEQINDVIQTLQAMRSNIDAD